MSRPIRRLVTAVAGLAAVSIFFLILLQSRSEIAVPLHDPLGLVVLILLAALLEGISVLIVTSRGGRLSSSVAPIPHLAMIPLFGPLIAALGTAAAAAISDGLIRRLPATKATFNISQLTLAVSGAGVMYVILGGPTLPSPITVNARTVLPFIAASATYFGINYFLVTAVVALDSGETFGKTWPFVTVGVLPSDMAAVALAFAITITYAKLELLGLLILLLPLLFLHHTNQVNVRLRQLNRDLLTLIVKTIEAKDPYTSGHSMRVAQLSRWIAQHLRLSRKTVEMIETAALLHDFGKVDVAYGDIISHAGPLTERQRAIIQSHPVRGAELLGSISTLDRTVLEAVRHHHEHFDGTGYPDGLTGEDIPLAARIIMVADTIDAMSSARPYRPPLSPSHVKEELRRFCGKQFDPRVAEAVIQSGTLEQHFARIREEIQVTSPGQSAQATRQSKLTSVPSEFQMGNIEQPGRQTLPATEIGKRFTPNVP